MQGFWLTFTDDSAGYCEGESEYDAKSIAEHLTGKTVAGGRFKDIEARILPYPASPIIWQFDHPKNGKCPEFCYTPKECAGQKGCPHKIGCTN